MKKILALVLAVMMLFVGMSVAFAGDGDPETPAEGGGTPATTETSDLTPDASISITGLGENDKVDFYKVLKWVDGEGWKPDTGFTSIETKDKDTDNDSTMDQSLLDRILTGTALTKEDVEALANLAKSADVKYDDVAAAKVDEDYVATKTSPEVGMYLALVAPGKSDVIYNPMIVVCDYDADHAYNTIDAGSTYSGVAVAKKSSIPLEKEIDTAAVPASDHDSDKKSVAPGDTIPFVVTSKIPTYAKNYTNPTFEMTDTLSTSLEMSAAQQAAITVTVAGVTNLVKKDAEHETEYDYEITPSASGYTIKFSKEFLYKNSPANPAVTVKYEATVKSLAENETLHNVERYDNTVEIKFSNNPNDNNSFGTRDDETHHYTFSIDANLNGKDAGEKKTKELVKIEVDAAGNVIEAWRTSDTEKWTSVTTLEGATFKLVGKTGTATEGVELTATSDENGAISFYGLDAGEYTLTEETAPAGYIKDSTSHTVKIEATYKTVTDPNDGSTCQELDTYTITIDDSNTSTYTWTNESDSYRIEETSTNVTTPIVNTKGVELPSTGGMGTTILYVAGSILVLAAGILLVTKRRMNAED